MHSLTHIAVFMRIVESGSFTAAAKKLGLSKPTVSKHIATLEDHLGARLLNRTTRSLGLTEIGKRFHVHCRTIMAELDAAETEVLLSSAAPRGRLRITAPSWFGDRLVTAELPDFLALYPDIEIEMSLTNRFVDLIKEDFDLAIRIAPEPPAGLGFRHLLPCVHIVCAAPCYCDRHGRPARPGDLGRHSCLVSTSFASGDCWRLAGPDGVETVKVSGRFRADNGNALHMALLSGLGLSLIPQILVEDDLKTGRLCNALPDYQENSYSILALYPHEHGVPPKVQAVVDHLAGRMGRPDRGADTPACLNCAVAEIRAS